MVKNSGHSVTAFDERAEGADAAVTEPALSVEVVESIGAGDAFAAGYLAGLLRGYDQPRLDASGSATCAPRPCWWFPVITAHRRTPRCWTRC